MNSKLKVKSKKEKVSSNKIKRAVVLLSGGLDSAVTLFYAKNKGFKTYSLTFDYGQRHKKEIKLAAKLARRAASHWQQVAIELPWKGSSLLDKNLNCLKTERSGPEFLLRMFPAEI